MTIRAYCKNDFPAILDIYGKSKLDELRYEVRQFQLLPLENDEKRLAELLESKIFVYEIGGIIVGYCALFGAEIRALFVHPDARREGVGRQLLEFALLKIDGAATLFVAKSNAPAKDLYAQYGFTIIEEFETTYNRVSVQANKMVRG